MRNVFVVIVFACIGLSYEFIVPLGILKVVDETRSKLMNNKKTSKERTDSKDMKQILLASRISSNQSVDLETVTNRIEDHELYDQSNDKQSNISERSFVFINQKFRTTVFGPIFGPLYPQSEFLANTTSIGQVTSSGHKRTLNHHISGTDSSPSNVKVKASSKQNKLNPYFIPEKKSDYQNNHKHLDVGFPDKTYISYNISETTGTKNKTKTTHFVEASPVFQPINKAIQRKVEPIWPNFYKSQPHPLKKPKNYIPFESNQMSQINPIIYEPDNNGYPSPFGQRSNKPEEIEKLTNYNSKEKYHHMDIVKPRIKAENLDKKLIKKIINDDDEISKLLNQFNESGSNETLDVAFECKNNDCNWKSKLNNENKLEFEIQENTTDINSIELNDYRNTLGDETLTEKLLKELQ